MRAELSVIEKIECYLMGTLSEKDKLDFQNQVNQNTQLQKQVEFQSQIIDGVQRLGLKSSTQRAYQTYKIKSLLTKALVVAVIAAAVIITTFLLSDNSQEDSLPIDYNEKETQIIFPEDDSLSAEPNQFLDQEIFKIKTDQDTIIETKDGIVVYIPAGAFETDASEVDLLLQVALTTEDILTAGLSTITADGQELETGGMFYVDAFVNGNRVNMKKELTIDVPSGEPKAGMQLYEGEKNEFGEIVWNNPSPLESFLTPVEITTLDFYPPNYKSTLNQLGYSDKIFMDSLYYSFVCGDNSGPCSFCDNITIPARRLTAEEVEFLYNDKRPIDKLMTKEEARRLCIAGVLWEANLAVAGNIDTISLLSYYSDSVGYDYSGYICPGINPASVKTIWRPDFNNTNLATREFEERMPWIHKSCNNAVLDLYINNLDKKLSTVDSMALKFLSGEVLEKFKYFAARDDGRVELDNQASQKMAAYYIKQQEAHKKALLETRENYWNEQYAADNKNNQAQVESDNRNGINSAEIFQKEYQKNLCKVYDELALDKDCNAPVQTNFITIQVRTPGWKNIDRLVFETTAARQTTTFSEEGKTSTITYNPWAATIADFKKYNRIHVYNIPLEFNSFIKLRGNDGKYEYQLNADLTYQTVVLAWTEEDIYFFKSDAVPGNSSITLRKVSTTDWQTEVRNSLNTITNMSEELDFIEVMQKDQKRINTNREKIQLRQLIEPVVFPCGGEDVEAQENRLSPL